MILNFHLSKKESSAIMNEIPDVYNKKFTNGIRHPHLYLWDSWSYIEHKIIHLYCLAISRTKPDGTILHPNERNDFKFHIRHFTSVDDGLSWKDEGCFFMPNKKLNHRTIWSGCVKPLSNGNKLVAYTGLENIDSTRNFLQNIEIAVSNDGYVVHSLNKNVLSSPLRDWNEIIKKGYYLDSKENLGSNEGEKGGPIMAWRDPFIFYDNNSELNLFWSAKSSPKKGALARATIKNDGDYFKILELHPPVHVPDINDFTQLEVPKVLFDKERELYYLIISTCNRLYENQPDSEIRKEVRLYKSDYINGPWKSMGEKILGDKNLFGLTVLKTDFDNNRLLCIAPYTEVAEEQLRLTFAPTFYIYLDTLEVEFLREENN